MLHYAQGKSCSEYFSRKVDKYYTFGKATNFLKHGTIVPCLKYVYLKYFSKPFEL